MTFIRKLFLILIGDPSHAKSGRDDSYDHLSDEELVERIAKSKSPMLFGILYDRYVKMVYNKCYGFSKSSSEAEDLTQDVFLTVYLKLSTFKGKSKFSTWLYSLTYNFCTNYVNRDKQRKISENSMPVEETKEKYIPEVSDKEILEMQSHKLKKALDLVDPEDRSILLLKYQDDTSIKDLAELLDIGESAVKMRLKRAKAKIVEKYHEIED